MAGNAQIGALHVLLALDSAQFRNGLKLAQGDVSKFAKIAAGGFLAVTAAAAGATAALGVAVRGAINHADALAKSAQKAGTTVEALSRLEFAAKLSDVSLESLTAGLQKLSKSMADALITPTSNAATAFKALGISLSDAQGNLRNSDEVLSDTADRFARLGDGSTKTALAMQIFGRSGAELIPLLNSGRQGLRDMADESDRLGLTISTGAAKGAERFNDTLTRISGVLQGVVNKVMEAALPALQGLADKLASPEFAAAAQQLATWIVTAMTTIVDAVTIATLKISEFGGEIKKWASIAAMIASGNFGGVVNYDRMAQVQQVQSAMGAGMRGQGWAGGFRRQPAEITVNGGNDEPLDVGKFTSDIKAANTEVDIFGQLMSGIAPLLETTRGPFEQMAFDLNQLDVALAAGKISWAEWGKGVAAANWNAASATLQSVSQITGTLAEAFKENKALAVANAVVSTAAGAMKAFEQGGIFGFAGAASIIAAGAVQIGNILSAQPGSASLATVSGSAPSAASAAGSGQSIYLNIKGSGSVNVDDLVDQMTKQIADGGHQGFIKVMRAA